MKPLKAYLTEYLFNLTNKFPRLFPTSLKNKFQRFSIELYFKNTAKTLYKRASILDHEGRLTSINITTAINHNELVALYKKIKVESSTDVYNPPPKILHTEPPEYPINTFQFLAFNSRLPYAPYISNGTLQIYSMYSITIIHLTSDSIYLSIDLDLNENVDRELFNIDTSAISEYYFFKSLNPFSRNFLDVERSDSIIQEKIVNRLNKRVKEAKKTAKSLMRSWGILADNKNFIVSGHFINSPTPYIPTENYDTDEVIDDFHLLSRTSTWLCDQHKARWDDRRYLYNFEIDNFLLDSAFIDDDNGQLIKSGYCQSHLFLSLITEAQNQYKKARDAINPLLLKISENTAKDLQCLFEANLESQLLKKRALAITNMIDAHCFSSFQEQALKKMENLNIDIDNLLSAINERKTLSNEQMQLKNLRFNKYYSLIVAALALLQVVLAAIVIDWTGTSPVQNPVIQNLTSLFKWLSTYFH